MGGYSKNIAVIKGLKDGFSADGGALTGLVKAERYGTNLKIEVTLINFAPLTEGRYVTAVSDGNNTLIVENGHYEGVSSLDTGAGFAALVCYINSSVSPVASAVSGNFHGAALTIKAEVERAENIKNNLNGGTAASSSVNGTGEAVSSSPEVYQDEAIAEVNYYEFAETDESGGAVCQNPQEEENGRQAGQNEAAFSSVKKGKGGVDPDILQGYASFSKNPPLAGGDFYNRVKKEIEGIFGAYPAEENLEKIVQDSRWVKISYGDNKYYVFGVISSAGKPQYICYGVPSENNGEPPESMRGLASFIPSSFEDASSGYWVMYQDAATGASLKIDLT